MLTFAIYMQQPLDSLVH